jgi:hypothetical protein
MSWQDVYTFYVEPDDDYCPHSQTEEQAEGVYCLDCGEYIGTPEDLGDTSLRDEAEKREGTADCLHLYMMPNYEGKWHCSACGWTEGQHD